MQTRRTHAPENPPPHAGRSSWAKQLIVEAETKAKSGETRDFVGHDRDVAKRTHAEVGEEGPVADEQDPEEMDSTQPHKRRELSPRN